MTTNGKIKADTPPKKKDFNSATIYTLAIHTFILHFCSKSSKDAPMLGKKTNFYGMYRCFSLDQELTFEVNHLIVPSYHALVHTRELRVHELDSF